MKAILAAAAFAAALPGGALAATDDNVFALCLEARTAVQPRLAACTAAVIGRPEDAKLLYAYGFALRAAGDNMAAAAAFERAAEAGHVIAKAALGTVYLRGVGRPADRAMALHWYRRAAEGGHAKSQAVLGFLYFNAEGDARKTDLAAEWLTRAALQGVAEAQFGLGALYAQGDGVAADPVQAHMWFAVAAAKLPEGAERKAALNYQMVISKKMTLDQIDEAKRLAEEWSALERR